MEATIDIHYTQLEEWLHDRRSVIQKQHPSVYEFVQQAAPQLLQQVKYDLPATRRGLNRIDADGKEAAASVGESLKSAAQLRSRRSELLQRYHLLENFSEAEVLKNLSERVDRACAESAASLQLQFHRQASEAGCSLLACLSDVDGVLKKQFEYQSAETTFGQESDLDTQGSLDGTSVLFPWLWQIAQESQNFAASEKEVRATVDADFGLAKVPTNVEDASTAEIDWGDVGDELPPSEQPTICLDLDDLNCGSSSAALTTVTNRVDPTQNEEGDVSVFTAAMPPPQRSEQWTAVYPEKHRAAVVAELQALHGFFLEQLHQAEAGGPVFSGGGDVSIVRRFDASVGRLSQLLINEVTTELLRIHYSYRHKEKFLRTIEQLGFSAAQKEARVRELEERVEISTAQVLELQPKLEEAVIASRNLKKEVENQLGRVFDPREVRLVGDISKI